MTGAALAVCLLSAAIDAYGDRRTRQVVLVEIEGGYEDIVGADGCGGRHRERGLVDAARRDDTAASAKKRDLSKFWEVFAEVHEHFRLLPRLHVTAAQDQSHGA